MLHHAHFDMKGGEPPFAAVCTKVSYAQIVYFAKCAQRCQDGLSRTSIQVELLALSSSLSFKAESRILVPINTISVSGS
jgi:hypothetical protein